MDWRDYAEQVQRAGDKRDDRDKKGNSAPNVPIVPNVPVAVAENLLRSWRTALSDFDPWGAWAECPSVDWIGLHGVSCWWLRGFGEVAARNGWSTADVFGILPGKPRWGGLIDRLGDNSSLVMTADRATWRSCGVAESYLRTAGEGLVPFWEATER